MKRKYKPIDEVQEKLKDGVYNLAKVTIKYIHMSSKSEEEKKNDLKKIYDMFNSLPEEFKSLPLRYGLEFVCGSNEELKGLEEIGRDIIDERSRYSSAEIEHTEDKFAEKDFYSYKEAGKYFGIPGRTIGRLVSGKKLEGKGKNVTTDSVVKLAEEMKDYYFLAGRVKDLKKKTGLSEYLIKSRIKDYLINFGGKGASSVFVYKKIDEEKILEKPTEKKKKEKVSKNTELVPLSKLKDYGLTAELVQEKLGDPKKIDAINAGWPKDEIEKLKKDI